MPNNCKNENKNQQEKGLIRPPSLSTLLPSTPAVAVESSLKRPGRVSKIVISPVISAEYGRNIQEETFLGTLGSPLAKRPTRPLRPLRRPKMLARLIAEGALVDWSPSLLSKLSAHLQVSIHIIWICRSYIPGNEKVKRFWRPPLPLPLPPLAIPGVASALGWPKPPTIVVDIAGRGSGLGRGRLAEPRSDVSVKDLMNG